MTLEEKQNLIYETYKKRSKKWSYKCDVFVFNTPKSFSNLFSDDSIVFDSLWVQRGEISYTRVWTVCVSSSGVVFGQLYLFPLHFFYPACARADFSALRIFGGSGGHALLLVPATGRIGHLTGGADLFLPSAFLCAAGLPESRGRTVCPLLFCSLRGGACLCRNLPSNLSFRCGR